MTPLFDLIGRTATQVWQTLAANWPFLVASAVIACVLKVYLDQDRVAAFFQRHRGSGVLLATGAAVGTPLCSCGTAAVILGMMAGSIPWAPIVAFMVASPLTSPQELVFSAGLFGWRFALAFFIASVVVGVAGGLAAHLLESRGWLTGQARFRPVSPYAATATGVAPARADWRRLGQEVWLAGRRLLLFFLAFAFLFLGYLLNNLIPAAWITTLFGEGRVYGVPLAAALGVPFYFNTEASLPLARGLMEAGMSQAAVLAFLVIGAGTSIGALAGALTIARWRVVGLVVGALWGGAVICGYAYSLLLIVVTP
jgi:uncharacterized membrane protein YraQ (UPF0718 family)